MNEKVRIFGIIPLFEKKEVNRKIRIYIFNVLFLKLVRTNSKKIKAYLFGLIPFLKLENYVDKPTTYQIVNDVVSSAVPDVAIFNQLQNSLVSEETILIIEPNMVYHSECLVSYVKYFIDLGYNVHMVISNDNLKLKPFCRFNSDRLKIFSVNRISTMFSIIGSYEITSRYKKILVTTAVTLDGDLFSLQAFDKEQIMSIVHSVTDIKQFDMYNKISKNAFVLSYFDSNNIPTVNPHYFGDINITQKNNDLVEFVTVGRLCKNVKNYDLLIDAVRSLKNNGFNNFKINVIGWHGDLDIDEDLKPFIDIKGRLDFNDMFKVMESSDYFLSLLDPESSQHMQYTSNLATGSNQLVLAFRKPYIINNIYADAYKYDSSSAIVYEKDNLYDAMLNAINLPNDKYVELQNQIKKLSEALYETSLKNLKGALND